MMKLNLVSYSTAFLPYLKVYRIPVFHTRFAGHFWDTVSPSVLL